MLIDYKTLLVLLNVTLIQPSWFCLLHYWSVHFEVNHTSNHYAELSIVRTILNDMFVHRKKVGSLLCSMKPGMITSLYSWLQLITFMCAPHTHTHTQTHSLTQKSILSYIPCWVKSIVQFCLWLYTHAHTQCSCSGAA